MPLHKSVVNDTKAYGFDRNDIGWVIMSIGMAIGAGIVFLPVQIGLVGLWVFFASAIIGYPAMYLFQRLFINTLAKSKECTDYPCVISGYLGKNWGVLLGLLYFIMLAIWVFVYSTAITNDSASYFHTFGITSELLSQHWYYPLGLITILVMLASRGEEFLFKVSTILVLTKLGIVAYLGFAMVHLWEPTNVGTVNSTAGFLKDTIVTLPFTLTSILFIQTLSPMVIFYRNHESSVEVARVKAQRAMTIAFVVLFVTVFFYAVSFTLAMGYEEAERAFKQNVSALAIAAQFLPAGLAPILGVVLNIFAVVTAFFGVYLGFSEAIRGLVTNIVKRYREDLPWSESTFNLGIAVFIILLAWSVVILQVPILYFTSISSPVFGLIGCLIPAYLVYRVESLRSLRGPALPLIVITGILLIVSPFFAFL